MHVRAGPIRSRLPFSPFSFLSIYLSLPLRVCVCGSRLHLARTLFSIYRILVLANQSLNQIKLKKKAAEQQMGGENEENENGIQILHRITSAY